MARNYRLAFLWAAIGLLTLSMELAVPAVEGRGEYQAGLDCYQQKRYLEAGKYFEMASMNDPNNEIANYYAGYCFYLAGRPAQAIVSLRRLCRRQSASKESSQARALLRQIDPDFGKEAPAATASVAPPVEKVRPATARELVTAMIKIQPGTGKLPNVTNAFVEKVKEMLVTVPVPVLLFLQKEGAQVVVGPSVVEHDQRIQNTAPRGWSGDYNWKQSPALTHGRKVFMAQYRLDGRTGDYVDTSPEVGVVRHELGHALDHCLGDYTETDAFKHAYLLDAAKVPDEYQDKLHYFLQKADSGPSETFAELFCYRVGGETDNRQEKCELVHKYFPNARSEMVKMLSGL